MYMYIYKDCLRDADRKAAAVPSGHAGNIPIYKATVMYMDG